MPIIVNLTLPALIFLILEGAQAGLSWITILKKQDNYRAAYDHFDPEKIVRYDEAKVDALMQDTGIVRNRLKAGSYKHLKLPTNYPV